MRRLEMIKCLWIWGKNDTKASKWGGKQKLNVIFAIKIIHP